MIRLVVKDWWQVLDNGPDDQTAWDLYKVVNPTLAGMYSRASEVVAMVLPPHLEARARQVMAEEGIQEVAGA